MRVFVHLRHMVAEITDLKRALDGLRGQTEALPDPD
jgi:hypothetical protein